MMSMRRHLIDLLVMFGFVELLSPASWRSPELVLATFGGGITWVVYHTATVSGKAAVRGVSRSWQEGRSEHQRLVPGIGTDELRKLDRHPDDDEGCVA